MKLAAALALLALPIAAAAQFKCTDAAGRVAFQQTPCAAQEKQLALKLPPATTR